jgi:hypothetical protein
MAAGSDFLLNHVKIPALSPTRRPNMMHTTTSRALMAAGEADTLAPRWRRLCSGGPAEAVRFCNLPIVAAIVDPSLPCVQVAL